MISKTLSRVIAPIRALAQWIRPADRERLDVKYAREVRRVNKRTGARLVTVSELREKLRSKEPVALLDIREAREHAVSALPGARLLVPSSVRVATVDLSTDVTLITYCTAGYRSGWAAVVLEQRLGRPVYTLSGGIIEWFNQGGEVRDPAGQPVDLLDPCGRSWARYVHPR